ncbi:hypothetical protein ACX8XP_02605 [Calditrichota bacterium LG25]
MHWKIPALLNNGKDDTEIFAVKIVLDSDIKAETFRSFLLQLKSLGIKSIILAAPLLTLEKLLKAELTLISLFKDFKVSVLFLPDFVRFFASDPVKNRKYLLKSLFCNVHYFKRYQILGFPVFHFWGEKPEIYSLKTPSDLFKICIPMAEDVDSIFLIKRAENGNIDTQIEEITAYFDRQTGTIKNYDAPPDSAAIIVLRAYYFSSDSENCFYLNYFDSSALAALQKQYKQSLDRLPLRIESIFYALDQMFEVTQQINKASYSPTLENVLNGMKKTIAYYYYLNAGHSVDNFFLKIVFKRFFNSVLRSRMEVIAPRVNYLVHVSSSLVDILPLDNQFLLSIDFNRFQIDTPYFWQSFGAIKQMAAEGFANNQTEISVLFSSLSEPALSAVEHKIYFDLLAQAGATRFWLNVEKIGAHFQLDSVFLQLQIEYLNQLINFLNKGMPTAKILMLMPSLDQDNALYFKSIELLSRSAIQFELISFDQFSSATLCKIEGKHLLFNQKAFDLIILPAIRTIPYRVLKKLFHYFKQGGHIAAFSALPGRVELKEKQKKFKKLIARLWLADGGSNSVSFIQDDSGGKSYFIPHLKELNTFLTFYLQQDIISVEGQNILIKVKETQNFYFIFLTNILKDQTNRFVLKSRLVSQPYEWNFESRKQTPVYYWNTFEHVMEIPLKFAPWESRLLLIPKDAPTDNLWHLSFCSSQDFLIDAPDEETFVLALAQEQLGPVDVLFENDHDQIATSLMITEQHLPLILPEDHWVLEIDAQKKAIHLQDLELAVDPQTSTISLRNTFMLKQFRPDFEYLLDLGALRHMCHVRINSKAVGMRWYPPFHFKLSKFLKNGENEIELILSRPRIAGAHVLTPTTGYTLKGPLRIRLYKKFVIKTNV